MGRVIGIRHRVKKTIDGESRPTQLAILENGLVQLINLKTEDDELDFIATRLLSGDRIVMLLGGSGDNLAYALSNKGQQIDCKVYRISPFVFIKKIDEERDKDQDAHQLAALFIENPELFYEVTSRDRDMIWVIECFRARIDAMKARIACEQRIRQHFIGSIFCSPQGFYPEGSIEKLFEERKSNNHILQALLTEEKLREKELEKALEKVEIYIKILETVEGCGPLISARLISAIVDIRRFETKTKLRAFCGVHLKDGRFPRKRTGEVANWHNDARQALYLLGDQFNRRPNSIWGLKLRDKKTKLRAKHPEVEIVNGKKRYTNGHIQKMALWWVRGKFVEWLFREWWRLEKEDTIST